MLLVVWPVSAFFEVSVGVFFEVSVGVFFEVNGNSVVLRTYMYVRSGID